MSGVPLTSLPFPIQDLCEQCLEARKKAYAPYSKFYVGAALQSTDGPVFRGCNVENASYGMTICAERTAFVKAVSEGHQDFCAIAICGHPSTNNGSDGSSEVIDSSDEPQFVSPCGACRQFMCEFHPGLSVYMVRIDRMVKCMSLAELLPESFSPKNMAFKLES